VRLRLALVILTVVVLGGGLTLLDREVMPIHKVVAVVNHAVVTEPSLAGFKQGMAALGWVEGRNISYLYRGPEASPVALRAQAKEYVDGGADLVVALSTPATQAAVDVTVPAGVPLLMAPSSDPVGSGLVKSVSNPGRPVTGVSFALQEPRRLEWLARLVPGLRVVWFPYDPTDPSPNLALRRIQPVADKLGITLVTSDIRSVGELRAALTAIPKDVQAIFVPPDARIASAVPDLLAVAFPLGLAVSTPHREGVSQGALFSYGFDLTALGIQAARLGDQILKGIPASDLPIESAEFSLSVNIASATRLGVAIPDDVLRHARIFGGKEP
jgi:putative ABC transport system substrate-binding protein